MKVLPWVMPEEPEIIREIFYSHGTLKSFPKGTVLRHGGEDGTVYLVDSGLVTFGFLDFNSHYQVISLSLPGRTVGDLDSLDPTPCSVIAEVLKPVQLYCLHRSKWIEQLRSNIRVMEAYAQSANYKHQCTMQGMIANYTWPLADRLRLLFYSLITSAYEFRPNDWNPLPVKINNTELATVVSVNRSWVSRTLSRWGEMGVVKKDGRILLLHASLFSDFPRILPAGQIFHLNSI